MEAKADQLFSPSLKCYAHSSYIVISEVKGVLYKSPSQVISLDRQHVFTERNVSWLRQTTANYQHILVLLGDVKVPSETKNIQHNTTQHAQWYFHNTTTTRDHGSSLNNMLTYSGHAFETISKLRFYSLTRVLRWTQPKMGTRKLLEK